MFNPQRLSLARKRRKHTKKSLAEAIGVTPLTLTRLEAGENQPEEETINKLSAELKFPVPFFFGDDIEGIHCEGVSFRKLSTLTIKDRDASLASGEFGVMFADWVAERFNLPELDIPDLSADYTAEGAALALREYWGLGQIPINDIVKLLESKGVRRSTRFPFGAIKRLIFFSILLKRLNAAGSMQLTSLDIWSCTLAADWIMVKRSSGKRILLHRVF
jgi:transcriptional regulator with XRE-family HTH domain